MSAIPTQNDRQSVDPENIGVDVDEQSAGTSQSTGALSRGLARASLWLQRPVVVVMLSVAAWLVAVDVVAVAGARLIDPRPEMGLGAFTSAWMQWDAGWFERIVTYGYHAHPSAAPGHPVVYLQAAFYPGYPLIARGVFDVVHLFGVGVAGAMLLTNQALVFVMAFLVYKMVVALTRRTDIGVRTVHYLLLYPFAYFLLAPYSETAFLTFVAGFVWALTARRYVTAGLLAAAAGVTRPVGFVLPLVLAVGYLEQHDWNIRTIKPRIVLAVVVACVGAGVYAIYQWLQFGSLFYSQTVSHIGWASSFSLNLWRTISDSITHPLLSAGSIQGVPVEIFINLSLVTAFAVLTVIVWRRFGVALGLMCAGFIVIPLLSGTTFSWNRFMLPLLPCFVVLGMWGRRSIFDFAYRTVGTLFLALFLIMFTHSIWTG